MAKKLTPKEQEIKMIEDLFSFDGYFTDEFRPEDVHRMTSNIKNDFPVFTGTIIDISVELDEVKERLNKSRKIASERLQTISELSSKFADLQRTQDEWMSNLLDFEGERGEVIARRFFGDTKVLVHKVENGFPLSDDEKHTISASLKK